MSATPSASTALAPSARPAVDIAAIDASCRWPLLVLFLHASLWLVAASVLGLIASIKFHGPGFLAHCPWLTYGRVQPAAVNAMVYGFACQAGLALMLWLMARLGRTLLAAPGAVITATLFWNLGVLAGVAGILGGGSTGHVGFELPLYATAVLFASYCIFGVATLLTFIDRRQTELYPSQWFLVAAAFWFPWLLSGAILLLQISPVRGVMQAVVTAWYASNVGLFFLGFIGIAALLYFVPKLASRPLHSRHLALLAFWMFLLFGGYGGVNPGAPLPAWIPALSTVTTVLLLVPVLALGIAFWKTSSGVRVVGENALPWRFICFAMGAWFVASVLSVAGALPQFSRLTEFTLFQPGRQQLFLYGFFAMTVFGAAHFILPRLVDGWAPRFAGLQFGLAAAGITLFAFALIAGGLQQGRGLAGAEKPFMDVFKSFQMLFRLGALGEILMLAANGLFAASLLTVVCGACCRCCCRGTACATPAGGAR